MLKRIGIGLLTMFICGILLELGERFALQGAHSVITNAQAVVGRPLTPVSYAGVARRTARRCASGAYAC